MTFSISSSKSFSSLLTCLLGIVTVIFICATIGLAIALGITLNWRIDHTFETEDTTNIPCVNQVDECPKYAKQHSTSKLGIFHRSAVASDATKCATVGKNLLLKNGTAVDAALATLFCNGVIHSHSMGIGGGLFMIIYIKSENQAYFLNAREVAPQNIDPSEFVSDRQSLYKGPKSFAVPGELMGYHEAKSRFGNPQISWHDIISPTIKICESGLPVTRTLATALVKTEEWIIKDPEMRKTFTNSETNELLKEGEKYYRPTLVKTLIDIASNGPLTFYNGSLAQKLLKDLADIGSVITMEDLLIYEAQWDTPVTANLSNGISFYSSAPPGSGSVMGSILKVMDLYNLTENSQLDPLTYQRFIEASKFAYAQRAKLGDWNNPNIREQIVKVVEKLLSDNWARHVKEAISDFSTNQNSSWYDFDNLGLIEDSGTTHISVLAPNGDAVAVTSTINSRFGSAYMSPSTGIILNNQMEDFSVPGTSDRYKIAASPFNYIKPGMRPMSSMSPTIFVKDGTPKLIIGASGGSRIISSVAYATMRHLWLGQTIKEAIDSPRVHHQLLPMSVQVEYGVPLEVVKQLKAIGHVIEEVEEMESHVQAVAVLANGIVTANHDFRKRGQVDGF